MATHLNFVTVDVFTDRQFGGNPLAVVLNADGLTTAQMQTIAAEFNLAETTFVRTPQDAANTAEVRIFTPRIEMPFAGHPNVGTAFVLARAGEIYGRPVPDRRVLFEQKAGLTAIDIARNGATVTGARLAAPQPLSLGTEVPVESIVAACALSTVDIETRHHKPCVASCGAPFVLAELRSREALSRARAQTAIFAQHCPAVGIHLYTHDGGGEGELHCRMFAPHNGVPEDPATGSANVALIGLLAKISPEGDLTLDKTIAQGFDMGRPSILNATAEKRGGAVTATLIGGSCVPVMRGTIELR
jgi:trans-2,3-dihydro-3-hydroxyanthranilate isomerase